MKLMKLVRERLLILSVGSLVALLPAPTYAETLFFDDFETGDFSRWDGAAPQFAIDSTRAHSGTYSFKVTYPNDESGGGPGKIGTAPQGGLPLEFYISWWVYFEPGFHFPVGLKMYRAMTDMNTGGLPGHNGHTLILYSQGAEFHLEMYAQRKSGDVCVDRYLNFSIPGRATPGSWHEVKLRIRSNTFSGPSSPNANGVAEMWWDGVGIGRHEGVVFRCEQEHWVRHFWVSGNYTNHENPPVVKSAWWDDIMLSDKPFLPPDQTPPNPPSNPRVVVP